MNNMLAAILHFHYFVASKARKLNILNRAYYASIILNIIEPNYANLVIKIIESYRNCGIIAVVMSIILNIIGKLFKHCSKHNR